MPDKNGSHLALKELDAQARTIVAKNESAFGK